MSQEHTSIWRELDSWAQSLDSWERLAVHRTAAHGAVSPDDLNIVWALFPKHHDLGESKLAPPQLEELNFPLRQSTSTAPLKLLKIGNLQNCNAIPSSSELTFDDHLTVVFGSNGSGKTGFGRVLARTCFCRHEPAILPNVYADIKLDEASAEITIQEGNDAPRIIHWNDSLEKKDLVRIAMFDSAVARIHIAEQTTLGFKPIGFDVFPELARVYHELQGRLDTLIEELNLANEFPASFLEESKVSRFVEQLNENTDVEKLRELATFGDSHNARLKAVDAQIASIRAQKKDQLVSKMTAAISAIMTLKENLIGSLTALNSESVDRYSALIKTAQQRLQEAATEGAAVFSDLPLPEDFGSSEW